jgi:hypothetical protein
MRITCVVVEDFLENLKDRNIYQKIVYVNRTLIPVEGSINTRNATSLEANFQVSSLIELDDGGLALVICEEECGMDRRTADGGSDGSDRMRELFFIISNYCDANGLVVKPGILDM